MNFSIPNWAKPLLTVAYSVSGFIVTEVPVLLGVIPASVQIDGTSYSTAALVGGLSFILSGAYYVHSHLQPYIVTATPSPAPTNTAASTSGASSVSSSATSTPTTASPPSGVPAGAVQATASNVAYTTAGNGAKTPRVPIGSWVVALGEDSSGVSWWDVYSSAGQYLVKTNIDPLA